MSLTRWTAGTPPEPPSLDPSEALALVRLCERHRLLGALGEAVRIGTWKLAGEAHAQLSSGLLRWQTNSLLVEALALDVGAALEQAGVEYRLLKGVAVAHSLYDQPGSRVFADLDLLVPGEDLDRTVEVLETSLDGRRALPDLRPGFAAEFGKDVTVRARDREIDVHRTLAAGPFGLTIPLDELFRAEASIELAGRRLPTLEPLHQVMHACYNAALGDVPTRMGSVRDVVAAVECHPDAVDEVAETARRWHGTAVVVRAAQLAVHLTQPDPDHPLRRLAEEPVPHAERRLLATYLSGGRSYRRQIAALAVIPGLRARARYLRALTGPSSEYLRARGWTRGRHVRRAAHRLRGRTDE